MENFFDKFPGLGKGIFDQIDNQNLAKCKEVGEHWYNFINNQKVPWIRMIQKYAKNDIDQMPEMWKTVLDRTPTEIVKELAIAVQLFYKDVGAENNSCCGQFW